MISRLRVAFFTPLCPVRSGVSDYSEDIVAEIARAVDVDVIVDGYRPSDADRLAPARVQSVADFVRSGDGYDLMLYQVGNNHRHHGYMLPFLRERPGILVLHDYCLHHLVLGDTLGRGDFAGLERMLAAQYGQSGRRLAWQLLLNAIDPLRLSFAGELIRSSRMTLVHSSYARGRLLPDHPDAMVRVVPMGVREACPVSSERAAQLRARVGLRSSDTVVASVSTPARNKRLDLVVRAFARALEVRPHIRLLILGAGLLQREARAEIDQLGGDSVIQTGWLSGDDYRDLIAISDLVLDLRYPAAAETSASLLRAFLAGKPAIVAEQGPFSELPDGCCVPIPIGPGEERTLADAIVRLVADQQHRERMGVVARTYARERCTPPIAAAEYVRCIEDAVAQRLPRDAVATRSAQSKTRPIVAGMYNAGRVGRLWRTYGASDTWRRICEEVHGGH